MEGESREDQERLRGQLFCAHGEDCAGVRDRWCCQCQDARGVDGVVGGTGPGLRTRYHIFFILPSFCFQFPGCLGLFVMVMMTLHSLTYRRLFGFAWRGVWIGWFCLTIDIDLFVLS